MILLVLLLSSLQVKEPILQQVKRQKSLAMCVWKELSGSRS